MRTASTNRTASPDAERTAAMAKTIVMLAYATGDTTHRALMSRGFSQDEIDRLDARARAMARAEIDREWKYYR